VHFHLCAVGRVGICARASFTQYALVRSTLIFQGSGSAAVGEVVVVWRGTHRRLGTFITASAGFVVRSSRRSLASTAMPMGVVCPGGQRNGGTATDEHPHHRAAVVHPVDACGIDGDAVGIALA